MEGACVTEIVIQFSCAVRAMLHAHDTSAKYALIMSI